MSGECLRHNAQWFGDSEECPVCELADKLAALEAEREALVQQLWAVALADGGNSADEDAFIRRICPLLAVDDRVRILARQRAEAARGARQD